MSYEINRAAVIGAGTMGAAIAGHLANAGIPVTLLDIVQSIEGPDLFRECILGLAGCGERRPCPLHRYWGKERARIETVFRKTTLARLARETARDGLRLAD